MLKRTNEEGRQSLWGLPRPEITWTEDCYYNPSLKQTMTPLKTITATLLENKHWHYWRLLLEAICKINNDITEDYYQNPSVKYAMHYDTTDNYH